MKPHIPQNSTQLVKTKSLLLILLGFFTLFSCPTDDPTSTNPPVTPLPLDYEISGNFYIALNNAAFEIIQKGSVTGLSNFAVNPPLPKEFSIGITSGNIKGSPTTVTFPIPYTVTATADGKGYTNTISLGVAPSLVWVTNTNSGKPFQLTAFMVGDGSKQTAVTWSSSDDALATVNKSGAVSLKETTTKVKIDIMAETTDGKTGKIIFDIDKIKNVNGGQIVSTERDEHLTINSGVKEITDGQFSNKNLTKVTIAYGVTSIDRYAFDNNPISNVLIPNSVTSIGYRAFRNNRLVRVVIPDSVKNIALSAFFRNSLTSVVIGNGVTNIGAYAFQENIELTNLILGSNVIVIGYGAFERAKLTQVKLPNSLKDINSRAFSANSLTNVMIGNSVRYIGTSTFSANSLTSLYIPNSVTNIRNNAFTGNPNLKQVNLNLSLYNKIIATSSTNAVFGTSVTNYIKRD